MCAVLVFSALAGYQSAGRDETALCFNLLFVPTLNYFLLIGIRAAWINHLRQKLKREEYIRSRIQAGVKTQEQPEQR